MEAQARPGDVPVTGWMVETCMFTLLYNLHLSYKCSFVCSKYYIIKMIYVLKKTTSAWVEWGSGQNVREWRGARASQEVAQWRLSAGYTVNDSAGSTSPTVK